ncbi:MAG: BREX-3 system P-loop-containing protein BrxF [Geoalkalibacter sp.]|uniref:BREX-3 system P-loop-containing protein BrxF n=1 Tax=Geoalkalibacter sp. TaxID=3041440 RepID=UPI003D10431C
MLDLTERRRALQLPRLLGEIVGEATGELVLLDNIENLFDVHLEQDPLRLLQGLSGNKTVVAAWNGPIADGHMTYAVPGHPEYRRYPIQDLVIVVASSVMRQEDGCEQDTEIRFEDIQAWQPDLRICHLR